MWCQWISGLLVHKLVCFQISIVLHIGLCYGEMELSRPLCFYRSYIFLIALVLITNLKVKFLFWFLIFFCFTFSLKYNFIWFLLKSLIETIENDIFFITSLIGKFGEIEKCFYLQIGEKIIVDFFFLSLCILLITVIIHSQINEKKLKIKMI